MVGDPVQPGQLRLLSLVSAVSAFLCWSPASHRPRPQPAGLPDGVTWLNTGVLRRLTTATSTSGQVPADHQCGAVRLLHLSAA